jgi:hypothetical protein
VPKLGTKLKVRMKIVHGQKERNKLEKSQEFHPNFCVCFLPGLSLLLFIFFIIKSRHVNINSCKSGELIPSFDHFLQQRCTQIETGVTRAQRQGDFADVISLLL